MVFDPLVPADTEFLGEQEFQCRVSPVRRGLLVRAGNLGQAREALHAAAAVWGGARFPLLPVDADGVVPPAFVQLAEALGVQEVADFTAGVDGESAWTDDAASRFFVRPARPLDDAKYWSPHPVAAVDRSRVVRELYLPGDDSLVNLAGAGGYGLDDEVPLMRANGWNVMESAPPNLLATHQMTMRTALSATLAGDVDTEIHGGGLATMGILWVASDPDSFDDAAWFWNVRAVRPRMHNPSGVEVLTTLEVASLPEFREEFARELERTSNTSPSLVVASLSVGDEVLQGIAESLGATKHEGRLQERFGRPRSTTTMTFAVNMDPCPYWMAPRKSGPATRVVAQLRRPSVGISFRSPMSWVPKYAMSGKVHVDISSPSISGPQLGPVAALFHSNGLWAGSSLRLTMLNQRDYWFNIDLPLPAQVLRAAVQPSGYTMVRSDKGQQVIGAATRDPDIAFYRRILVAFAIGRLTAKVGRDLAREIRQLRELGTVNDESIDELRSSSLLGSRPARTLAELKSEAGNAGYDKASMAGVLDELVRRGVAQMGFVVRCPLCSLTDFQLLSDITQGAVCGGCQSAASFMPGGSNAPEVYYRLSSLIHTLSLNGGIAPLAALALLTMEKAYVDPGVNLFRDGKRVGELDLVGWQGASLFAGESKMSAAGFAVADIDRDVDLAASIGADAYIAVCAEPLPEGIRATLEECTSRRKMSLRVLGQSDLFDTSRS